MTPVGRSGRTLVASDWHLGHFSPAAAGRLALAFLERARDAGDDVILNGDIFEGLFESSQDAEAAHPRVSALVAELAAAGRLRRTEGNHDPGSGAASLVLEHPALGRVLVSHGHLADPMHRSLPQRFGDGISRRFGRLAVVRGAARFAEAMAGVAGGRVEGVFRARCLVLVDEAACALGIFGHVHRQHLVVGDRYANAGQLRGACLEYAMLTPWGAELSRLTLADLAPSDARVAGAPAMTCSTG